MEGASIGFLIGAIVCLMAFLAGRISADVPGDQEKTDKGWKADTFIIDEFSRPFKRKKPVSIEEMQIVIDYFSVGASRYEKQVLDAIKERIENE